MLKHGLAIFNIGARAHYFQCGVQRDFCVHDDLRPAGKMHDQIRAQAALFGIDGLLFLEIAVRRHAGQFHGAPQRQLAPLPLHLWLLERADQASCFLAQFLAGRGQELHLASQAAVCFLSRGFDAGHFACEDPSRLFPADPPWPEWPACGARDPLRLLSAGNRILILRAR